MRKKGVAKKNQVKPFPPFSGAYYRAAFREVWHLRSGSTRSHTAREKPIGNEDQLWREVYVHLHISCGLFLETGGAQRPERAEDFDKGHKTES